MAGKEEGVILGVRVGPGDQPIENKSVGKAKDIGTWLSSRPLKTP
jgi:hypothetical protein